MEQSFSHVKAEDENPSFLLKLLKTTDTNTEQLRGGGEPKSVFNDYTPTKGEKS